MTQTKRKEIVMMKQRVMERLELTDGVTGGS